MLVLKFVLNFIKTLNAESSPRALAGGLALGMLLGLVPKLGLLGLLFAVLIFMSTVNGSAAALSAALFTAVVFLLDPLLNKIGHALLTAPALKGLWTTLYNTPVVPWTRFNNTLVMGGFAAGLILLVPSYFLFRWGVLKYREKVLAAAQKWKIFQLLKASKLHDLYNKFA